jgi:hypothetical protein
MSSSLTQRASDPADFGTDKRGVAARWIAELRLSGLDDAPFIRRAREVERRYLDERSTPEKGARRFNVFWSNVQTLKPAIYATPPKAVVQRRYLDADPVARAASTILQRAIQTNIDQTGWHDVTDLCVLDYLIVGRGVPWVRYEPHFEDVQAQAVQGGEAAEGGQMTAPMEGVDAQGQIGPELQPNSSVQSAAPLPRNLMQPPDTVVGTDDPADDGLQVTNNAEGQEITYEEVCWDYINWQDFRHSPCRTWQEVRWVARRVLMALEEGVERFGDVFRDVPRTWRPEWFGKSGTSPRGKSCGFAPTMATSRWTSATIR